VVSKETPIPVPKDLVLGDLQDQYDNFSEIFYSQLRLNINTQLINSTKGKLSNSNIRSQGSHSSIYTRHHGSEPREEDRNYQTHNSKHDSLRFSFEKMVAAKNKPFMNPIMNTLA
jgi:hypothetical protein